MVFEMLSEGAGNAITSKELCKVLNISARDLTAAVERERRAGNAICASTGRKPGYYKPRQRGEMEQYCTSLARREAEIRKTRNACIATLDKLPL